MVAYLKSGSAGAVLDHLAARIGCTMLDYPNFASRVHRTSDHTRVVPQGKTLSTSVQMSSLSNDAGLRASQTNCGFGDA